MIGPLEKSYEVLDGSGTVSKLKHRSRGTTHALWTFEPESAADKESFRRDMGILEKIRHPHIAEIHEVAFDASGNALLVGEEIHGPSLADFCSTSRLLPVSRIQEIALQSLQAIDHLHGEGLRLRHLAPNHILLTQDAEGRTRVKLAGLDVAKARGPLKATTLSLDKARYGAPEEMKAPKERRLLPESNLYSWAVILYQALTGSLPFAGSEASDLVRGHLHEKPRTFRETDPLSRVREDLRSLLTDTLAKNPADRPRGRELIERLEGPPVRTEPWVRRFLPLAAALLLLGVGVYFLTSLASREDGQMTAEQPAAGDDRIATPSDDRAARKLGPVDVEGAGVENADKEDPSGTDPSGADPSVADPAEENPADENAAEGEESKAEEPTPEEAPDEIEGDPEALVEGDEIADISSSTAEEPAADALLEDLNEGNRALRAELGESVPGADTVARAEESAPASTAARTAKKDRIRAGDSSLLLKVVGLSDNIPITRNQKPISTMEVLKPYFVLEETASQYRVSSIQGEGGVEGFVAKSEVESWNTREGLHFRDETFRRGRRASVAAWESENRIRRFARAGDTAYGPTFKEELQTRVGRGTRGIIPYPLLDIKKIGVSETLNGKERQINEVLIPAIVSPTVETSLSRDQVRTVAGAVTFCVVFDATQSMGKYAKDFAGTIEQMLSSLSIDTRLASAGFVLFRDLKNAKDQRFEMAHPMPLGDATKWLRQRVRTMVGGDDAAEPVLDAVVLAQNSFLWNGGTAVRGARRVIIVVANEDAKPQTVGLASSVPKGLGADEIANRLRQSPIPMAVFSLQAGNKDGGNLIKTMTTLSDATGGEFYRAAVQSDEISREFSEQLKTLLSKRIGEGEALADAIGRSSAQRADGGTVIALNVLDDDVRRRLEAQASSFHISEGGVVINKAWMFEDPNLYSEKILIEKDLLEWLVRFFNSMTDSALDAAAFRQGTAKLLEAMAGESFEENVEVQELLEKRLGIHFSTNLLDFDLEELAAMGDEERDLLREQIEDATGALADFLDLNARHFNEDSRIWMPVSYLP